MTAWRFQPRIVTCWDTLQDDGAALLSACIRVSPSIPATAAYRLFYCIREDGALNMYLFEHTPVEEDPLVYSGIHRNTRHALEAYVDLFNLVADGSGGYLEFLKHMGNRMNHRVKAAEHGALLSAFEEKTGMAGAGEKYTFSSKMKIFRRLSPSWEEEQNRTGWEPAWWDTPKQFIENDLYQAFRTCSTHSHPDLFTRLVTKADTVAVHEKAARTLLRQNLAYFRKGLYLIYMLSGHHEENGEREEILERMEISFDAIRPWAEGQAPVLMEELP